MLPKAPSERVESRVCAFLARSNQRVGSISRLSLPAPPRAYPIHCLVQAFLFTPPIPVFFPLEVLVLPIFFLFSLNLSSPLQSNQPCFQSLVCGYDTPHLLPPPTRCPSTKKLVSTRTRPIQPHRVLLSRFKRQRPRPRPTRHNAAKEGSHFQPQAIKGRHITCCSHEEEEIWSRTTYVNPNAPVSFRRFRGRKFDEGRIEEEGKDMLC